MNRVLGLALALVVTMWATPAFADLTAFLGATTTPEARLAKGFALGAGLLVVGFEFEYSATDEDPQVAAPGLKSGMGNVLLQTPVAVLHMQPYFTTGAGAYQERLGARERTAFAGNIGGGVKIGLVGPLRLRLDYRAFNLGSEALTSPAHRVYAGLNLRF
jgi:hypothetical protein